MNQPPVCVLIADDDEDDCYLLERAFAQHSPECQLEFAQDGLALLAQLERSQSAPCLIVLDLNMPRLDGFETLTYLRAHPQYRTIPIVMLTTSEAEADREQAQALGADLFITKPIDNESLGQTVCQLRTAYLIGKCC